MRTFLIFDNIAPADTTVEIPLNNPNENNPQDLRFLIQASKTGVTGNPRIIIEESLDKSVWTALENTKTWDKYTDLIDILGIKDNYFMGKFMRVRMETNGATGGTVWAKIGYKTKP